MAGSATIVLASFAGFLLLLRPLFFSASFLPASSLALLVLLLCWSVCAGPILPDLLRLLLTVYSRNPPPPLPDDSLTVHPALPPPPSIFRLLAVSLPLRDNPFLASAPLTPPSGATLSLVALSDACTGRGGGEGVYTTAQENAYHHNQSITDPLHPASAWTDRYLAIRRRVERAVSCDDTHLTVCTCMYTPYTPTRTTFFVSNTACQSA